MLPALTPFLCHPCCPRKAELGQFLRKKPNKSARAHFQLLLKTGSTFACICSVLQNDVGSPNVPGCMGGGGFQAFQQGWEDKGLRCCRTSWSVAIPRALCWVSRLLPEISCSSTSLLSCDSNIPRNCAAYLIGLSCRAQTDDPFRIFTCSCSFMNACICEHLL